MAGKFAQRISPFLWFDGTAEAAANFYVDIFPNSKIAMTTRYTKESAAVSGQPEGQVMSIGFVLDGQEFAAINGGPHYRMSGAISFVVHCNSQEEVDHYWDRLCEGGDPGAQRCGWLTDKFGVTWQVVPEEMFSLMYGAEPERAARVAQALYSMRKIDLPSLQKAYEGV